MCVSVLLTIVLGDTKQHNEIQSLLGFETKLSNTSRQTKLAKSGVILSVGVRILAQNQLRFTTNFFAI